MNHICYVSVKPPSGGDSFVPLRREMARGLNGLSDEYDLVIVGAGLSGSVIAQQASSRAGLRSLIIDKRDHIGGNCYDYIDDHGIRVSCNNTFTFPFHRNIYLKSREAGHLQITPRVDYVHQTK